MWSGPNAAHHHPAQPCNDLPVFRSAEGICPPESRQRLSMAQHLPGHNDPCGWKSRSADLIALTPRPKPRQALFHMAPPGPCPATAPSALPGPSLVVRHLARGLKYGAHAPYRAAPISGRPVLAGRGPPVGQSRTPRQPAAGAGPAWVRGIPPITRSNRSPQCALPGPTLNEFGPLSPPGLEADPPRWLLPCWRRAPARRSPSSTKWTRPHSLEVLGDPEMPEDVPTLGSKRWASCRQATSGGSTRAGPIAGP